MIHLNIGSNLNSKFGTRFDNISIAVKLLIESKELKKMNKIERNKKVYKILNEEMNKSIHSLQILIY